METRKMIEFWKPKNFKKNWRDLDNCEGVFLTRKSECESVGNEGQLHEI